MCVQKVGRKENIVGWYHSHPGYGCWLSGIDVGTQMSGQQGQEPWLAIVVDPLRTMSAGASAFTYRQSHSGGNGLA
jgi:COP9 signalosome complex subunit 5